MGVKRAPAKDMLRMDKESKPIVITTTIRRIGRGRRIYMHGLKDLERYCYTVLGEYDSRALAVQAKLTHPAWAMQKLAVVGGVKGHPGRWYLGLLHRKD